MGGPHLTGTEGLAMKKQTIRYILGNSGTGAYGLQYDPSEIGVFPSGRAFAKKDTWGSGEYRTHGECYRPNYCEISRAEAAKFLRAARKNSKSEFEFPEGLGEFLDSEGYHEGFKKWFRFAHWVDSGFSSPRKIKIEGRE